jgi:hypothetical protein
MLPERTQSTQYACDRKLTDAAANAASGECGCWSACPDFWHLHRAQLFIA